MECRRLNAPWVVLGAASMWLLSVSLMLGQLVVGESGMVQGWALLLCGGAAAYTVVAALVLLIGRLVSQVHAEHAAQTEAVAAMRAKLLEDLMDELDLREQSARVAQLVPSQR